MNRGASGVSEESEDAVVPERGRRTVNTVPPPDASPALTVPPWALVIDPTIERPRPVPPWRRDLEAIQFR